MAELGELCLRLIRDEDSRFEIFSGGYSDIPELQKETRDKVEADEWDSYIMSVAKAVPGGWEVVDSLGGTVTEAGHEGTYSSISDITSEEVRDAASQVWESALTILRENTEAPEQSEVSWPLGVAIGQSAYDVELGVLGFLDKSGSGNTILHVGNTKRSYGSGWVKCVHVVLSPGERERLIADLIAQRNN